MKNVKLHENCDNSSTFFKTVTDLQPKLLLLADVPPFIAQKNFSTQCSILLYHNPYTLSIFGAQRSIEYRHLTFRDALACCCLCLGLLFAQSL